MSTSANLLKKESSKQTAASLRSCSVTFDVTPPRGLEKSETTKKLVKNSFEASEDTNNAIQMVEWSINHPSPIDKPKLETTLSVLDLREV